MTNVAIMNKELNDTNFSDYMDVGMEIIDKTCDEAEESYVFYIEDLCKKLRAGDMSDDDYIIGNAIERYISPLIERFARLIGYKVLAAHPDDVGKTAEDAVKDAVEYLFYVMKREKEYVDSEA